VGGFVDKGIAGIVGIAEVAFLSDSCFLGGLCTV